MDADDQQQERHDACGQDGYPDMALGLGGCPGPEAKPHSPRKTRKMMKAPVSHSDWNSWWLHSFPSTCWAVALSSCSTSSVNKTISAGWSWAPPAPAPQRATSESWGCRIPAPLHCSPGPALPHHPSWPQPLPQPLFHFSPGPGLSKLLPAHSPQQPHPWAPTCLGDLPAKQVLGPGNTDYFLLPGPHHLRPWQPAPPPTSPPGPMGAPTELRPDSQPGTQQTLSCCCLHE
nr:vegetative cell wall protein gp1-like [Globicephala melas]